MRSLREKLLATKDSNKVVKLSKKTLKQYPDDLEIIKKIAVTFCYPGIDRNEEGIGMLQKAMAEHPNTKGLHAYLAECYIHTCEYQFACEELKLAIDEDPNNPDLYHLLASEITGGWGVTIPREEAILYLHKAISLAPENWQYYHSLGIEYWQQGELALAKEAFQSALDKIPDSVPGFHSDKDFHEQLQRWLRAIDAGKPYVG